MNTHHLKPYRIISKKLEVNTSGQIQFFQIQLPYQTTIITGVNWSEKISGNISNFNQNQNLFITDNRSANNNTGSGSASGISDGSGVNDGTGENTTLPPRDTRAIELFEYKPSFNLGELRLQSLETANIFYREYLSLDRQFARGDVSALPYLQPTAPTHQSHQLFEPILVEGKTSLIQGMYLDALGKSVSNFIPYQITVYLKIQQQP
jgi:hypothetical protein